MAIRDDIVGEAKQVFVGDDKSLEFEIFSQSATQTGAEAVTAGVMKDVSGYALAFHVRRGSGENEPVVLSKATGGLGVAISGTFNAARASNTQRVTVTLADTDTLRLKAGDYYYTLKRTDDGSETMLAHGKLTLLQGSVR